MGAATMTAPGIAAEAEAIRRAQELVTTASNGLVAGANPGDRWTGNTAAAYSAESTVIQASITRAGAALGSLAGALGSGAGAVAADAGSPLAAAASSAATVAGSVPLLPMAAALGRSMGGVPFLNPGVTLASAAALASSLGLDPNNLGDIPGWVGAEVSKFTGTGTTDGLTKITVPVTVNSLGHADVGGWFFANDFTFQGYKKTHPGATGNAGTGYIGLGDALSPFGNPDLAGQQGINLSVFGPGTSSDSPGAVNSADLGPGTTTEIAYPWKAGDTYSLSVERTALTDSTETWTGTVYDYAAEKTTTVGSWTVPASWGTLGTTTTGFAEYPWPVTSHDDLPDANVTFGATSGEDSGGDSHTATTTGAIPYSYPAGIPGAAAAVEAEFPGLNYYDASADTHATHTTTSATLDVSPANAKK